MAPESTPTNAAHLLRRAAWGGTPDEIVAAAERGIEATVDELLDPSLAPEVGEPMRRAGFDAYELGALESWFVRLAATSRAPAIERLTWFWSGHFATSVEKVEMPDLLHRQYVTCRRLGLGRFDHLLEAISRDAAMNVFLDLHLSVVGKPNENFARELMELFSLGVGNGYTQADVVSASRALTGYGLADVKGRTIGTRFLPGSHDYGTKTFLGVTGRLDGHDIIRTITARRECHEFVARRFWHRYAGTDASSRIIGEIADAFAARLRIDDLLRRMLTMEEFYRAEVRGGLVSQPFEVLVRTVRGFGLDLYDAERTPFEAEDDGQERSALPPWFVETANEQLGQHLGMPPNVAGWPHNEAWLDSNRSAGRLLAGIELGHHIARLGSPTGVALRESSGDAAALSERLLAGFGVVERSPETTRAIAAAIDGLDDTESVASAFAVAFTSPEVTLA